MLHIVCSESDEDSIRFDQLDPFNHPRERRTLIIDCFQRSHDADSSFEFLTVPNAGDEAFHNIYGEVHAPGLLELFRIGWSKWEALGDDGQDSSARLGELGVIPINMPIPRNPKERPSQNIIGQLGYYCTDNCTPLFSALYRELCADASVLQDVMTASKASSPGSVYYCLLTHPGHHAAYDSFGGYCYVNHAVALAESGTAILDVDYHAGNGTVSMCRNKKDVFVVSIHCDPDFDYPFHSGWADDNNIPLPPGTTWKSGYEEAIKEALHRIQSFSPKRLIISLGLDTHLGDPCAIRRAGFRLEGKDYERMGTLMAQMTDPTIPVFFIQEGGYRMDVVGQAACDVVVNFANNRRRMP